MDGLFKELEKIQLGGDLLSQLDIFQSNQQQQSPDPPPRKDKDLRRIHLDASPHPEYGLLDENLWVPEMTWPSYDDFTDQEYEEAYRVFLQEQMAIDRMPGLENQDDSSILPLGVFIDVAHAPGGLR
jgi:hypothetical protein